MVDYLSWPESELDEKFVVTSFEDFHKALDSLNSRLKDKNLKLIVNIVEHSGIRNNISHCKDDSDHMVAIATNLFKTGQSSTGTKTVKAHVFQKLNKTVLSKFLVLNSRS